MAEGMKERRKIFTYISDIHWLLISTVKWKIANHHFKCHGIHPKCHFKKNNAPTSHCFLWHRPPWIRYTFFTLFFFFKYCLLQMTKCLPVVSKWNCQKEYKSFLFNFNWYHSKIHNWSLSQVGSDENFI